MANNIFEQFDETYSRWSILDKVEKEIQLERMWHQMCAAYNYLFLIYQNRGYLTLNETKFANQLSQILMAIQKQKMQVDNDLANDMMKHLVKMTVKTM